MSPVAEITANAERYTKAIKRFTSRADRLERDDLRRKRLGTARLIGVIAGLGLLWWVESIVPQFRWHAVAAMVAAFIGTSVAFTKIDRGILHTLRVIELYLSLRQFRRRGVAPDTSLAEDHPFAKDLDILAEGGLYEHITLAFTHDGMQVLVRMLTEPASLAEVKERQAAVKELLSEMELRERFFVSGRMSLPFVRTDAMRQWAAKDAESIPGWFPAVCFALCCGVLVSGVLVLAVGSPLTYSILAMFLLGELAAWGLYGRRMNLPSPESDRLHLDFAELRKLLKILEPTEFNAPYLKDLAASLQDGPKPASKQLRGFCRLISLYEAHRNQIVAILGPLVLYETQFAMAMHRWRARHAARLPQWIDAIARFEAFCSLAEFSVEHPLCVFPALRQDGPLLQATGLAHPLMTENAVTNDITLDAERPVLVVSGAHMAGKSTLLRSVGVNLALANAGAPVRAETMAVSDLRMVASIRVTDSLEKGESRFYAELKRIRVALELIRDSEPTLLLVDELFSGTNSYDRYAGAVSLSQFLLSRGNAIAMLSTHDRHVTQWAEQVDGKTHNVHFDDVFEDGKMTFDYKLREGPAQRGNAIELMKEAGIPIQDVPAFPESTDTGT